MGRCYFCEVEDRLSWSSYWCSSCREVKNLCNVYGYAKVLEILKSVCIRDNEQIERKINIKKGQEISDEKNEFYLRRKSDRVKTKEEKTKM